MSFLIISFLKVKSSEEETMYKKTKGVTEQLLDGKKRD